MQQFTPIQTSWNGGELSPMMMGRTDAQIYAIAAEALENFVPAIEGPLVKAPGFRRVRGADGAEWVLRFVFSSTQSYALECHPGKLRYYTNGGRIESGPTSPYETTVPYASGEWPRVSTQQSYDVLYMAHGRHPPAELRRTSATTFDYAALELSNGPFNDGNSNEALTLTATGDLTVGGSVTLTQTGGTDPIFKAGHAGALFQIEALDFSDVPAWEVGIDGNVAGTTKRRSDGKVYLCVQIVTGGRTGTVQPTHEEGSEWDGSSAGKDINDKGPYGVRWEYLHDRFGIVRLDTIAPDGMSATATVIRRLPDSLATVASWRWAHGCFSEAEGWPDLVFVWNERLCFWRGFDLIASVVGDYRNFQQFLTQGYRAEDLAFRRTLSAEDPPHWTVVDRQLYVGTPSKEYAIGAQNAQVAPNGDNLRSDKQSKHGSTPVWPVEAGEATIYVQRDGRRIREADYDFGSDRYRAGNINRWARHIAGPIAAGGLIQLGHQASPEDLLFAVRGDGQMVFRSYDPEQDVKGFARRVLGQGGKVLSAIAIPSESGAVDEIWALCEWPTPAGGTTRSMQVMADWFPTDGTGTAEDAFFVDDGLSDALETASYVIAGLDHLAGVEVAILADGAALERQTVPANGVIVLEQPARKRVVGRPYTARARALRAIAPDSKGAQGQGRIKRMIEMAMRLLSTGIGVTFNAGGAPVLPLHRPRSMAMDTAPPLFSGDTEPKPVTTKHERGGRYEIVSDEPLPAIILAAMPNMEVADR